jgi:hypothetical protein
MQGRELRAEARIAVKHRGQLNSGETWFPCVVLDMSNSGFQMLCIKNLDVGQVLEFRCELLPQKVLDCKLEVRHFNDDALGAKIVEIDQRGHDLCQQFLQEQYSDKLGRLR